MCVCARVFEKECECCVCSSVLERLETDRGATGEQRGGGNLDISWKSKGCDNVDV